MSDRQIRLEALKRELEQRLNRYHAHQHREPGSLEKDFAEQAVQRQNDDVVDGLESETREELQQVRRALARVAAGTGDVCEQCGKPINTARLDLLPYTSFCVSCASETP
ncbi:TraR/DksA family transcriptional regulator [Saccharospirillum sp.]|uniref:TraR/DksA family transcriptional regulator n=1 Tax=Saccharospirillum sp. TaxID=2033801 RepID=UPI0034A08377